MARRLDFPSVSFDLPFAWTYGRRELTDRGGPMSPAEMLAAIGDPMRREIFERLTEGPVAVGELAGALPISRPAVSQHLAVLKHAGLVFERQQGTRRLYQVDPEGFAELRAYLDVFWDRSLASFRTAFPDADIRGGDADDDA